MHHHHLSPSLLLFLLLLTVIITTPTTTTATDEYARFKLSSSPPPPPPLNTLASEPYNLFAQAASQRRMYFPGQLRSKYCQCAQLNVTDSVFLENEMYMKAGLTSKLLTSARHESADVVVSVIHGVGPSNRLELKSNIQCMGAMRFGSASVNDTIRQVMNEYQQTKSEQVGSILVPPTLTVPQVPAETATVSSFVEIGSMTIHHAASVVDAPPPMRQWHVWQHDDFDHDHAHGWRWQSDDENNDAGQMAQHLIHCGNGDRFLAAHCVPQSSSSSSSSSLSSSDQQKRRQNVTKLYQHIPPHTHVEIQATVHFIDKWHGHVAYMLIDGEYAWLDTHHDTTTNNNNNNNSDNNNNDEMVNVCGHDTWADDRLSVPVSVVIPHTADTLQVTFGSNVIHRDGDMCVATLGVDDVMIWIKSSAKSS